MEIFRIERDDDGFATVTMDLPGHGANLLDATFRAGFIELVDRLERERDSLQGVVLASAKKSFVAGGDLGEFLACRPEDAPALFRGLEAFKGALRRLEKLGRPVAAAIAGPALGGGWELALACHHRVCVDVPEAILGMPECTLGLLPGAGGVVRTVHLLGLAAALPLLLEGRKFTPREALDLGLVQALAPDPVAAAKALLKTGPAALQPWDRKDHRVPGGGPENPRTAQLILAAPAQLRARTRGLLPAPEAALAVAVEATRVDVDTALRVETRALVELATGPVAKNLIATLWFGLNRMKERPAPEGGWRARKVGVLGAGLMGAGIAHACAVRGLETVLLDLDLARAEAGKARAGALMDKAVAKGALAPEARDRDLAALTPAALTPAGALDGCDLIVEAVFEDRAVKEQVIRAAEPRLAPGGIFGTNTSTLPVTGLAAAAARPEDFIGLHFFSPVDRMRLVEIIKGARTSPTTLAKACAFVLQLGKTPIVVNDSRGFYTSRVFGTYTNEGAALLADGVPAAVVENAALQAGMATGPLAVMDEVALTLFLHVAGQHARDCAAEGTPYQEPSALHVVRRLVEEGRPGRSGGAGFYDYPPDGPKRLWKGLEARFPPRAGAVPFQDVRDRLLWIQSLETLRCLEEGVLETVAEADVGSILGFGFPAWTGGTVRHVDTVGAAPFCERARRLAERYGDRFAPPALLLDKASRGLRFAQP